jgi:glycosyltransferase involved in cell wall biosynthesis
MLFAGLDNPFSRAIFSSLTHDPPAVIVAHKLHVMEFIDGLVPEDIPVLFDLDDVEHVAFERNTRYIANARERLVARAMVPVIRRAVGRATRAATHTFVCSPHDKKLLDDTFALAPQKVVVIPNSSHARERQALPADSMLLFVGTFDWPPNAQAVEFFVRSCWPQIKAAVPGARFLAVGSHPEVVPEGIRSAAGVEFTGFVPDIEVVYGRARIVVCPVLSGGGTRVKLVEAATFGKPIVSTHLGAEGLDFEDGRHALLRSNESSFADACIALLMDDARCEQLAVSAHEYARSRFDRNLMIEKIVQTTRDCIAR